MSPMDVHQRLTGNQAKPDKDGAGRISQEVFDTLHNGQPRFLQNVVGVDATVQSGVHAEIDHPPQPVMVLRKQFGQRILIALNYTVDEFGFCRIAVHLLIAVCVVANCLILIQALNFC